MFAYHIKMKRISRHIDVKAKMTGSGKIRSLKWRILEDNEYVVIKVDVVLGYRKENKYGEITSGTFGPKSYQSPARIFFWCRSVIQGRDRDYVLKYDIERCEWKLDRM